MKRQLIIAVISLVVGLYVGRLTTTVENTEYVRQKPESGTALRTIVEEVKPLKPTLPVRDTVYLDNIVVQVVDSAKIIEEYQLLRKYSDLLFDNEYGTLTLNSEVQYNKRNALSYEFVPIQKVTTIQKKDVFTPYVRTSYSSFGIVGVGAGVYYHDLGIDIQYQRFKYDSGYEVGINYKF